jgi:hypothetical protein
VVVHFVADLQQVLAVTEKLKEIADNRPSSKPSSTLRTQVNHCGGT